ncbi:MAG: OsmC family protein [Candidatus Aegiribacteria sp.]|nr:OsmC family protein [Candidatus Aegiribacteria sp.]
MAVSTAMWLGGLAFSVEQDGHRFVIDGSEEFGGEDKGPRPKNLLLTALIGCTGMDVVSILKKMKVENYTLTVSASGDYTEDHPRVFKFINIEYLFRGNKLPRKQIERAVSLSQDRYCGVSAIFRCSVQMNHKIVIENT